MSAQQPVGAEGSERAMRRIAALLAKAEATEHPAEAEALVEAAQRLATLHAIDVAVAMASRPAERLSPVVERITFEDSQARGDIKKHLVSLYCRVAFVNDVKLDVLHRSMGVILYGMPSDIAAVQALWTSLAGQMVHAGRLFLGSEAWRGETYTRFDPHTGARVRRPVDRRVARNGFYVGFIERIGERLREAAETATAEALAREVLTPVDDSRAPISMALVLADKAARVNEHYQRESTARGSWTGSRARVSTGGRSAGRAAADRAKLRATDPALPSGRGELTG